MAAGFRPFPVTRRALAAHTTANALSRWTVEQLSADICRVGEMDVMQSKPVIPRGAENRAAHCTTEDQYETEQPHRRDVFRRTNRQDAHSETALLYLDDDFPHCCDIWQNSFSNDRGNIV
jgi:DNA-binding helix-hairpin-helix protein with protein kinase domain